MATCAGTCYMCGRHTETALHHIIFGPFRTMSDREGFTVNLCPDCHINAPWSVHKCRDNDIVLRRRCQRNFEKTHSHEEWMNLVHRNYL